MVDCTEVLEGTVGSWQRIQICIHYVADLGKWQAVTELIMLSKPLTVRLAVAGNILSQNDISFK